MICMRAHLVFQFLLVRLRDEHVPDYTADDFVLFQFLLVRLREKNSMINKNLNNQFQFLLVRLRGLCERRAIF